VMIQVVQGPAVQQMQGEWLLSWMHLGGNLDRTAKTSTDIRDLYFPATGPSGAINVDGQDVQKAKVVQAIPGEHKGIFDAYLTAINTAETSILIENPYTTNPEIQTALIDAARRGVDVKVVLPGKSDHRISHIAATWRYPQMIQAGVRIFEYPGFSHGKIMVVDSKHVTIGSSNLDDIALRHVYELNLDVQDAEFAKNVERQIFDVDIPISNEVRREDLPWWELFIGWLLNFFHDLM